MRENIANSELSTRWELAIKNANGAQLFHTYKGERTFPMQCWFCDGDGWLYRMSVEPYTTQRPEGQRGMRP